MSEYQYYEFAALDRRLTDAEMETLRGISSRADITPTRFVNVYNYSDFRGDTLELMTRYFDAMVYVSNWSTRRLMLSLPADLIDQNAVESYCSEESVSLNWRDGTVVVDLVSTDEEASDWEEGEGWMGALASLRADLIDGDWRALYLAWLVDAQLGMFDPETPEPPLPPGLDKLSVSLKSLVDFLRLDPDLVAVAAEKSPTPTSDAGMESWIAGLPTGEKNRILLTLMEGSDPHLVARLRQRYRESAPERSGSVAGASRSVGELLQAARGHRQTREQAEAREEAARRAQYLDNLAKREAAVWQQVEQLVEEKRAKAYDQAASLLVDLRDLSEHQGEQPQFGRRCADLRERHSNKKAFLGRMDQAGLP